MLNHGSRREGVLALNPRHLMRRLSGTHQSGQQFTPVFIVTPRTQPAASIISLRINMHRRCCLDQPVQHPSELLAKPL